MSFKIDDDVPVPHGSARGKYPFRDMMVGQSFFVPGEDDGRRAASSARMVKHGKFLTRKVVENDIAGVRIWRIE